MDPTVDQLVSPTLLGTLALKRYLPKLEQLLQSHVWVFWCCCFLFLVFFWGGLLFPCQVVERDEAKLRLALSKLDEAIRAIGE